MGSSRAQRDLKQGPKVVCVLKMCLPFKLESTASTAEVDRGQHTEIHSDSSDPWGVSIRVCWGRRKGSVEGS